METQIRSVRIKNGLSQAEFARAVGIATTNACKLERARDKAGPKLRARVALALKVLESELFDADGWPLPPVAEQVAS